MRRGTRSVLCAAAVAAWVAIGGAQSAPAERVVKIPRGTYTFAQIVRESGTAATPIRYVPESAGAVTIRGGELSRVSNVILDGFTIDGRLDPEWPTKSRGVDIRDATNVTITNSEIIGPADIHTGYDISGKVNCAEGDGFPTQSGGIGSQNTENITFSNLVVHGFRGAGSLRGASDYVVSTLFRNNFNGLSISSNQVEIRDSVFWVHPNHLFSIQGAGRILLVNNLLVDAQDMFQAGVNWEGAREAHILKNTFYIPANKPCYGFTGMNLYNVKQGAIVRDNILVNKRDGWIGISDAGLPLLSSDFNLNYSYQPKIDEYYLIDRGTKILYEEWVALSGEDKNSIVRQAPQFTDPPQYGDYSANQWGFRIPRSVDEARSWFVLKPGSPGKNAASDGTDVGISAVAWRDTRPKAPTNVRITSN